MNVLFISTVRSDFYIGVYKKIKYQVLGFKQNNSSVDLVYCKDKNYYLNDEIIGGFWISSLRALSLFRLLIKFNLKKYDVLYVRYIYPSILTYLLIKLAIVRGFKGKVLVEIPSYPYEGEYSGSVLSKIVLRVDKYFARFLKKVVNKIVTYSEDSDIFEIPCVNIFNGIPEIESSEFSKKRAEKDIVITSVANYSFWHGVDRILNSMNEYRIENLKLNIVGFGVEINRLKEIVNNSSYLSNCVSFLGAKYDKELHEIYKNTDIALGCLGNHRKGIHTIQALKIGSIVLMDCL